jgi:hypothetical protein
MKVRELQQAILLGLIYVQSCGTVPPVYQQTGPLKMGRPDPPPPVVLEGPESTADKDRIVQLLKASGGADGASEKARAQLKKMIAEMGLREKGESSCANAGCVVDVTYGADVKLLLVKDQQLIRNTRSAYHEWSGSNGRTPPRREGNEVIATWYVLNPMKKADIELIRREGFK